MARERKPPAVRGAPVAQLEDTWKVRVGCAVLLVLFPIWLVAAPRWYAALGELHESKGRLTRAVDAYDRALAVWPRLFDASGLLFNRAVLLMSTESSGSPRHVDTEADLRTLLASQPDDANVNFNLGVVLSEMVDGGARAAEAEPYFRAALALAEHEEAEDRARRREAFGRLLSQLGRHAEAKQELERARTLQPASLALQVSHAIVLHAAGELERSIAVHTHADTQAPASRCCTQGLRPCQPPACRMHRRRRAACPGTPTAPRHGAHGVRVPASAVPWCVRRAVWCTCRVRVCTPGVHRRGGGGGGLRWPWLRWPGERRGGEGVLQPHDVELP